MNLENDTTLYGLMSAVLGAIGMFFWLIPLIGVVISAAAILSGTKAMNNQEDGWPIAGIVLGIVSLILAFGRSGLVYYYG